MLAARIALKCACPLPSLCFNSTGVKTARHPCAVAGDVRGVGPGKRGHPGRGGRPGALAGAGRGACGPGGDAGVGQCRAVVARGVPAGL